MNNKVIDIQNTIFRQIERLDDDTVMADIGKEEIARANAITNASASYIKAVNLQLAIVNASQRLGKETKAMLKELGVEDEKKN